MDVSDSDQSGQDQTSPLAEAIREAKRPSRRRFHHESVGSVAQNLHRCFEDEAFENAPLGQRSVIRSPQRSSTAPQTTTANESIRDSCCDMCLNKHEQKNAVRDVDRKYFEAYSSVIMVDRSSDGVVVRPFADVLSRLQRSVEASSSGDRRAAVKVALCRKCERQLKSIISHRNKKGRQQQIESIFASFFRRKENAARTETQYHTVQSIRCFMHGKGSLDCTEGGHYRPLRLENRSETILKAWKDLYSKKAGVGSYLVSQLLHNCRTEVLCPSHTSLMSNSLLAVELAATKCSICNRKEKKRGKQEVTSVDHEFLERNEDIMCIVEDALAVYTENSIQISQVTQLCAPCRLVVFRNVSIRENRARYDCAKNMRFDYGPTPSAIRTSIQWVRRSLAQNKKLIVFLKDVWAFYRGVVSEAEKAEEIRDARTLKKYLLPSLASTGIYLEMGSRKVGSYFCTIASFSALARDIKRDEISPSSVDSVNNMSPERERELLCELANLFKSKQDVIEQSGWSLRDFILAVPADLWRRKEWPCNPKECPADLRLRPNHEQRFASTMFCMLEQDAFEVSNRSCQGPLNYSLTLCGYMRADKEFMRLLNKVGIAGSYQSSQGIKNAAICQHMEKGAFSQTVRNAFHTVAVDNVNVRVGHSVAVHGDTYHGFNGTASQAVNSDVKLNFTEFLRSRPLSELDVRRIEGMDRESFMKEMFPTHDDPDLRAYRWIVVGLVLEHRDMLASDIS